MKKSDKERLKKIISTWESLSSQLKERDITFLCYTIFELKNTSP